MTEHRLLAVVVADAVGYSRLSAQDGERAVEALNAARAIFREHISAHGGWVIDTAGDSVLAAFDTATGAVDAATAIRGSLREKQCELQYRIGIHLGDVLRESDGSIYGDGVNIAARLQSLAPIGGIKASEAVRSASAARLRPAFVSESLETLKNIPESVRTWVVEAAPATAAKPRVSSPSGEFPVPDAGAILRKPAVAVLPLVNLGSSQEDDYFSDGLTEDITAALSRWKAFPVIARNSTFVYKGKPVDVRRAAQDLGARYVVEGTVRRAGDRLRVTVQLVDAEAGHQVWSERMDRKLDDIFAVQDEIAAQIASTVEPAIQRVEANRSLSSRTTSLTAWDLYQRGNYYCNMVTPEGAAQGRDYFEKSALADPTYAPAFSGIARCWFLEIMLGVAQDESAARRAALEAARTAVRLDDTDSSAHQSLGVAYMWERDFDRAVAETLDAVRHNPSNSWARIVCGNILDVAGRPADGIAQLEAGIRLNPLNPRIGQAMTWLAGAYLNARRYAEALAWADNTLLRDSSYALTHIFRAIALGHLDSSMAADALAAAERVSPGFALKFVSWRAYLRDDDNDHMLEGLRRAGFVLTSPRR